MAKKYLPAMVTEQKTAANTTQSTPLWKRLAQYSKENGGGIASELLGQMAEKGLLTEEDRRFISQKQEGKTQQTQQQENTPLWKRMAQYSKTIGGGSSADILSQMEERGLLTDADRAFIKSRNMTTRERAEQAEREYQSYITSEESYLNKQAAVQEYNAAHKWDALKNVLTNPLGDGSFDLLGLQAAVEASDQKALELKAKADYWNTQAQLEEDNATMEAAMRELEGWDIADRNALEQFAMKRQTQDMNRFMGADDFYLGDAYLEAAPLMQKYGSDKVEKLAESWLRYQNRQTAEGVAQASREAANGDDSKAGKWGAGALHSGLSVVANLGNAMTSPIGYLQEISRRTGQYSTLDPNNAGSILGTYAGAVRGQVAQNISGDQYDANGNKVSDGGWVRQAGATLYEAGMSAADSLARIFVSGGNEAISLGLAATGSFSQTVSQTSKQGANPVQAVAMGIVDGGLEVLTEKVSLDNLFKQAVAGPKSFKAVLKGILKSGAIEVSEEELSFLGSTIMEAAILREKSSYNQQIGALMAEGRSYAEAKAAADRELLEEAVNTAVTSFLSGSMMGGGAQVVSAYQTNQIGKDFAKMNLDKSDVQDLIVSGLESAPETESYQIAQEIQKQIEAGKTPSNYDLARLWQANAQAIAAEEAERAEGAEIVEPDDVAQQGQNVPENSTIVPKNTQNVTQNTTNVPQNPQNVPAAPLSVAAQLRQNQTMNGGNVNGTQQQITGPAVRTGTAGTGAGAGLLSGSGQWLDGAGAGESAGSMAGRAGQAAQRQKLAQRNAATVSRINRIGSLRLPRISSAELGLKSGTETKSIRLVPQEHWDPEMEQLAERIYQETGKTVSYVTGRLQVRGADGKVRLVNGVIYGDKIVVRADHLRLSMEQIADHEAYHGRVVQANAWRPGWLNNEIRQHIIDTYSKEEFETVVTKYVEALAGVYDMGENVTGEDYETLMRQIQEEVFADAYAGINAFGAGADRFTSAVNEKMEQLGLGRYRSEEQANGVRETAGPPSDMSGTKENTAEYGGERYSADDDTDNKYLQSANLTEEEIRSGIRVREFIDDVSGMINKAIRSKRKQKIGPVSQQHASVVNSIIRKINPNFSAEGYELWIDGTGAAHIEDRHGEHGKQDRSMASDEAKMLIPWASQNASGGDFLRDSKGNIKRSVRYFNRDQSRAPEIYLEKKIDDDTVYVSECVPDSENKRIWITSAYIKKGSNGQMLNMEESSPQPTPEAPFDGNATTYIVASAEQNVKNQEKDVFEMTDEEFQERYGLKLRAVDEVENGPDSQTFGESRAKERPKELFSVDDTDERYLDAVSRGDLETAQRMVDDAAKAAGYDSPMLYHGTRSFGFTEFDLSKMDDKRTIFLTDNERIAASYSGVMGKRDASGKSLKNAKDLSIKELVDELNSEQYGVGAAEDDKYRYSYLSLKDINGMILSINDRIENLQGEVTRMIREYADRMAMDFDDKDQKVHRNLVKLSEQLQHYQYDNLSSTLYMLLHHTDVFNDSEKTATEIAKLERDIRLMNKLKHRDNSEGVIVESWLNDYSLSVLDEQLARDRLEAKRKTGNYGLYAKLENPLEIDAQGAVWNDIRRWYRFIDISMDNTRVERRGDEYLLIDSKTGKEISEGTFNANSYTSDMPAKLRHSYMVDKVQNALSIITENMNTTREIAAFAQKRGYDGVVFRNLRDNGGRNAFIDAEELANIYTLFNPNKAKSADPVTYDADGKVIPLSERFNDVTSDIRYSVDDTAESVEQAEQTQAPKRRAIKPVAESRPILAKKDLRNTMMNIFSIPEGSRAELGTMIDGYADRLLKNGALTEEDRKHFFDRMYDSGVMTVPAEDYFSQGRDILKGGRVYVPESVRIDFGDDWNEIRRRAFGAKIYFTSDPSAGGIDSWNHELAEQLPGLFDSEETDMRSILERIVEIAEEGQDEKMSLAQYTALLAQQEYIDEDEFLDNMERQMDWALRTFAEKARLEIHLRDRTGRQIAKERAEHREAAQHQKDRKELRELQQRTLKTLQWLNKNRYRAPEELQAAWDEVLGDIDIYAVGAANEMRWSDRYNATWRDLAQMYKDASKNDPNFLPSEELKKIVARLDGTKIADMDIGALNDLYKAAVGLRTEFYNRNNVVNDEMNRLFAEVYTDAKKEIEAAPGSFSGKKLDKLINLDQLTPMNVLQRMGGWDPNGTFYSMAKQLEKGERDMRAYSVKAQKMLQDFLTEHEDWVKKADGQGKDGIWYEIQIPELIALEVGKKPEFGRNITVYMTPAQKVHLYLESKNVDNLRHMTGGRTFADKKLYSEGNRQEALAQGKTVRMAPETVKAIVSDMTEEELELARLLEQYYNSFATKEINRVSNILYGYDKAMGKNYAPIYTNRNYTKTEFGVFDQTAEGVGNLKGRQYAVNPSYNISAFDAFERHVDQTARFVGMAIPARNWTTLMNWREKNNSTGDVITHKWGEEGKRYITDLINTLQAGDDSKSDTVSSAISKLQSTYITAIFGANPSIVLKQLGSIPLASAYLDAQNVPTPAQIKNIDRELIGKYTQDLEWRTMGYSMPETKELKENPNWTQTNKFYKFTFGGGAITAMDGWAASVLWPWAANKVRRDFPELEMGTQEQIDKGESPFYKKVAELFEDALARSQSTSDEIHQSSLRKSRNPITKAFTMFRSDSAQTYNTLQQKIGEAQYYARTGAKPMVQEAAKKAVGAAFVSLLMNAMWSEAVNFLMALWKNKGKYYRDDEDELTFQSVAGEMVSGILGSFAGIVTGGEEVLEIIGNVLTGEKIYDIETPGLEQLNDVVNAISVAGGDLRDIIAGAADVAIKGGNVLEYFGDHSRDILGSVKELAETFVMYYPGLPISGLPVSNIEGYLLGALKWLSPELGTAYDDLFQNVGKSDLSGLEGGALESRVGRILRSRNISKSDDTAKMLSELYDAGFKAAVPSDVPASVTIEGEKHTLGTYQKQVYETIWSGIVADVLDDMVASDSFKEADPKTQAKMLSNLYTYAAEQAKAELFDEYELDSGATKNAAIVAAGATVAECITWNTITSEMKSGEKSAELASWDIPEEAKREIFRCKISDSREDSIAAFDEAGLSFDQFLQAYSMYGQINNEDLKAGMKAVEFSHWVNAQGYTAEQAAVVKDELTYFNMTPASSSRYDELVGAGMDPDEAYELTQELAELVPLPGEDEVQDVQEWRMCVEFSSNVGVQLAALCGRMSEKQYAKAQMAYDFGIDPDLYVAYYEVREQYDQDSNGSYTNAEVKAAVDSIRGLDTQQRAALWQIVTGNTSAKNNPYDRETGQKVLDVKAGKE